jgi:hypothetical protein
VKRFHQVVLIGATLAGCWLGMQAVHELGHVLGSWLTGGVISRVVLQPLTISRTDLSFNPRPLIVVWAGPIFGVLVPLAVWGACAIGKRRYAFLFRFFAGFCLIANGAYIAFGSFDGIGDCGEMLRHGSSAWQLWLFGALTIPAGLWLWHRQGSNFGFGSTHEEIDVRVAYLILIAVIVSATLEFAFGSP